ncbi:Gfo/Idh/MocA family protein [Inquilinus sp. CA228]|uniref:Gfo/Idh/MocA family protein n=1 Tax=Inquilinus sp. CA228 TaxID=3455609 RepID=UPI003F8D0186
MKSDKEGGWSVMGTGTIATEQMVAAIRSVGHEPLWVVSRNIDDAKSFSEDVKIAQTAVAAPRALRDPRVDFAYVSAARGRRRHYISAAAAAGKHVLCDGPISGTSRAARTLVDRCRQAGVLLALNQPFRASTLHQTMRRLLSEGEIGTLQSIVIVRGAPFLPPPHRRIEEGKPHGDVLLDMSIDNIDLARFLTGQDPVEVSALSAVPRGAPADQLSYSIGLSGGALFQAYESFSAAEIESMVMLAGDHGALIAHGTLNGKPSGTLVRRVNGKNELIPVRERDQHVTTVEGFMALVRRHPSWMCVGEDNVVALRAAEAVAAARARRHVGVA